MLMRGLLSQAATSRLAGETALRFGHQPASSYFPAQNCALGIIGQLKP